MTSCESATSGRAELEQGTDDDDAADRVGHRHERRVQGVVDVADDVVADDDREREHGEVAEEARR